MFSLFAVVIYGLACAGIGAIVNKLLFASVASADNFRLTIFRRLALDFGVGSSLFAAVLIPVALGGYLTLAVVWVTIIAAALVYLWLESRPFHFLLDDGAVDEMPLGNSGLSWTIAVASAALFVWYGLLAYTRPPFGDADAFYMTYPKIIAATGTLKPMLFVYRDFSTIGLLGELHFAALMVIADPVAAKVFAWLTGGFCVLMIIEITKRLGGGGIAQALVAAAVLTSTTFTDYLSDGKTELFPALAALTVIRILLEVSPKLMSVRVALAVGAMSAIAGYSKFSYIICLFPTIFVFTLTRFGSWRAFVGKERRRSWLFLGFCVIGAILGLAPHLLKNGLLFGNPLAPFLGSAQNWADQSNWFSSGDTIWIMLTYPIALVFGQYPLMGGNVSFLWLLPLPLIFFVNRDMLSLKRPAIVVTLSALVGVIVWAAFKPSIFAPRYFLANILLLMPLPMIAAETYLLRSTRTVGRVAFVSLTLLAIVFAPLKPPAGVWTAYPSKIASFILNGLPQCGLAISSYCDAFAEVNADTPPGKRVFVLGYYTFFLDVPFLQTINSAEELNTIFGLSPSNLWQALYDNGFSTVAVQRATHENFLTMLREAPVPAGLSVSERFGDQNMPVFFIKPR